MLEILKDPDVLMAIVALLAAGSALFVAVAKRTETDKDDAIAAKVKAVVDKLAELVGRKPQA